MIKVVLDANQFVSALLKPHSNPAKIHPCCKASQGVKTSPTPSMFTGDVRGSIRLTRIVYALFRLRLFFFRRPSIAPFACNPLRDPCGDGFDSPSLPHKKNRRAAQFAASKKACKNSGQNWIVLYCPVLLKKKG